MKDEIDVLLFVESRYKINRKRLKSQVSKLVREHGVKDKAEVSVAIIGDRKMRELNSKYKGKDYTTNVLSFSLMEGDTPFVMPSSKTLRLGDVVVSYPQAIREAVKEEVLVDDKIEELVLHGVLHLLGIHHEE